MSRVLRGDHCQCAKCGAYFNSTRAFDKHRIGTPGKDRRCRTATEMTKAGMVLSATDWWTTGSNPRTYRSTNSVGGDPVPDTHSDGSAPAPPTELVA